MVNCLGYLCNFVWEFFWKSLVILQKIFGNSLHFLLGIFREFFGNMKGIDLFVKILVFVKILSQGKKENFNP